MVLLGESTLFFNTSTMTFRKNSYINFSLSLLGALLAVIAVLVSTNKNENLKATDTTGWSRLLALGAFGSYALLLLGAYVHNRYFSGWPLVNNQLKPDMSDQYTFVHYLHRFAAGLGIIYIAYLVSNTIKRQHNKILL